MKTQVFLCFTLLFLSVSTVFGQWLQRGADINDANAGDHSGLSVSMSSNGNRVAVGQPFRDNNGINSGNVQLYDYINGVGWGIVGNIPGGAADHSGWSVSLSDDGNRVAIGAPYNDNANGNNAGRVRVYFWNGASWNPLGNAIDGVAADDLLGASVSLSSDGNRLAIGAYANDGNGIDSGHVRVYEYNGLDWVPLGIPLNGEAPGDQAGYSVNLSSDGNRLAVGARYNDNANGNDAGHVRVYSWDGATWNPLGSAIDGAAADDVFGWSVSLNSDGSRVAIGAIGNSSNGNDAGHARVYEYNGVNWVQIGGDINGENANDWAGYSVSLNSDGTRLAVGERGYNGDAGRVRLYEFDGTNWHQLGTGINGEAVHDQCGNSTSFNDDGSRIAIGSDQYNSNAGYVRVFEFIPPTTSVGTGSGIGGEGNVFMGYQAGANETGSNLLYIDNSGTSFPLIWGDFEDDILNFNGDVGIRLDPAAGNIPTQALDIEGTARLRAIPQDDNLTRLLVSDADGNINWRDMASITDGDADPNNEIQDLDFTAGILSLTNNPAPTLIDLSNYDSDVTDDFSGDFNDLTNVPPTLDTDATDDFSGSFTDLTNVPVNLDIDATDDFNGDFTNLINIPAGLADGDDVNDADASPVNELQTLNYDGFTQTLSINGGNSVDLSGLAPDNLGDHSVTQHLLPNSSDTHNLGAVGASFNNMYFNGGLYFDNQEFLHGRRSSVALGEGTLISVTLGRQNAAVGENALAFITTGSQNVAIGFGAGPVDVLDGGIGNSTAIGNGAVINASDQVRVGNPFVNDIGGFANWTNISDGRFKNNIEDDVPGLEFIEKLRPVSYTLDRDALHTFLTGKESETAQTISNDRHNGFIAQEVEAIVAEHNYAFWGVKKPVHERDNYGIRYSEFVVPLTKAVQELNALVEAQQQRIEALELLLSGTDTSVQGTGDQPKNEGVDMQGFMLYQNIPNPFHKTTMISALVPERVQQAKIIVYNLQGLELEGYDIDKRGNVSVEISGGSFPSGMYLYALIADGQVIDTKKMILTR